MGFVRCLDKKQISALYNNKNIELFNLLKTDILSGEVFPAVRKNQLYFYYNGGCLYKFTNGTFKRDKAYKKYFCNTDELSDYETAKKQIENKFTNTKGTAKERKLLDNLYRYTFGCGSSTNVIVLDIEVNLNGSVGGGKKCDLVLYNSQLRTLMFVEGKVFSDSRVNVKYREKPEAIEQVNTYTQAICEQEQIIIEQYGNQVNIINSLFGSVYNAPIKIIKPAKLLVYETPLSLTDNNMYSINTVNSMLGANNVAWFKKNERPSLDEIWDKLCK